LTITEPDVLIVTANGPIGPICQHDMITIYGTSTGGTPIVNYTWDNGVFDNVAFEAISTTLYTVTGTDQNGCTATDNILITVYDAPPIDLQGPQSVCCDEPIQYCDFGQLLQVNGNNIVQPGSMGYSRQWVVDGGHIVPGSDPNCPTIIWSCVCDSGWVKLFKTDSATGCTSYDSLLVIIHHKPNTTITGDTTVYTNANGKVYSVPCVPGQLYHWSVVGGNIHSGQGTCSVTIDWDWAACQDCPSSICVTVTSPYGCDGDNCITIHQLPLPGNCKIFGQVLYDNGVPTPMNGVTV